MAARRYLHRSIGLFLTFLVFLSLSAPTFALDVRVPDLRTNSGSVRGTLELSEVFTTKFKQFLEKGGVLHVRIHAELWEDRALWDKLVRPATIVTFRITRDQKTGVLSVSDPYGTVATHAGFPNLLPLHVDVAPVDRLEDTRNYYLHTVVTIGTVADRDIEQIGEAVFGSEGEEGGLGALGKLVLRGALGLGDYVQRASAESTSRKWKGGEIRKRT